MLLILLVLAIATSVRTWDCNYELGKVYRYHYTSELINSVPDRATAFYSSHGIALHGVVTLIPLQIEADSFYIEVYIESVQQQNIDTVYSHILDHSRFAALFTVGSDTLKFPKDQSGYETNVLRAIISALKIKSCLQTGVYTVDEVTVAGTHSTTYESNNVNNLMFDSHVLYPSEGDLDEWYDSATNNIDVIRRIGDIDSAQFTGSTAHQHKKFLSDVIKRDTTIEYSYLIGSLSIVQNCVFYEKYSPKHERGYASYSETSVRTTLNLDSSTIDPDSTYSFSMRDISSLKLYGRQLKEGSMVMEFITPDLRPSEGFVESGASLRELLQEGYETTSIQVVKTWLDFVRNIYVGIGSVEGRSEFDQISDELALPWFIDAANVNGTAQLHLLAHNAIKTLRALKFTERFIGTKLFTTDPPLRMLKWLLKTCGIERYEKVCALAIASSATTSFIANDNRNTIVNDIFAYLTKRITNSKTLEEKEFFVQTLANIKLPEATRYLVGLAINEQSGEIRRHAIHALQLHSNTEVTYEDRLVLLNNAIMDETYGGTALYYVLSSAPLHTLHQLIQYASSRICVKTNHVLNRLFHKTLVTLRDSRSDPVRAGIVRDELTSLRSKCSFCLQSLENSGYDDVANAFIFGSSLSGAELTYERYGGYGVNTGATTLSLNFLESFGVAPHILQTSLDMPDLDRFANGQKSGYLNVVVNNQRIKSTEFQRSETRESDSNVLLSDATMLIPTLSGLPLSYSMIGSMRTESAINAQDFPLLTLNNRVGMYLDTRFNMAGSDLGWSTVSELNLNYQEIIELTEEVTKRHTVIEDFAYRSDTKLQNELSTVGDVAKFISPVTLLNRTFSTVPNAGIPSASPYCEVTDDRPSISFENNKINSFDPKSHLGKWILGYEFSNIDQSLVYELSQFDCNEPAVLEGLQIDNADNEEYIVQIQALYGVLAVGSHTRVEMFSDRTQRNIRLKGRLEDAVDVLSRLSYQSLPDYTGPEFITLVVETDSFSTSVSLLFYVTGSCL